MRTPQEIGDEINDVQIELNQAISALKKAANARIAALEKEMKQASQVAVIEARQQIMAILNEHRLDAETVFASLANNKKKSRAPMPEPSVHYVGPEGQLWRGRGPHPQWLKGKDKALFERPGAAPAP